MVKKNVMALAVVFMLLVFSGSSFAENTVEKDVRMPYTEIMILAGDGSESNATFFAGNNGQAVILVPGAMYNKKSWYDFAERLQHYHLASLALNTSGVPDIRNAIAYLEKQGFEKLVLVGASMGGMGVLDALKEGPNAMVKKVVLLAPAGGAPLEDNRIEKLFITTEDDMIISSAEVYKIYKASADPKVYKEYEGASHAQRLFYGDQQEEVSLLIIDFINAK